MNYEFFVSMLSQDVGIIIGYKYHYMSGHLSTPQHTRGNTLDIEKCKTVARIVCSSLVEAVIAVSSGCGNDGYSALGRVTCSG